MPSLLSRLIGASLLLSSFCSLPLSVSGFTNGTLLPPYLCGVAGDGYPKSLGTVLPYLLLPTNNITSVNVMPFSLFHTQSILAGFHNNYNGSQSTMANEHPIVVQVQAISPVTGAAMPTPNVVYPGYDHVLTISSSPKQQGVPEPNVAADGALVYVVDANGVNRIGSFVQTGPFMSIFPGCGPAHAGAVHNMLISCNGISNIATYSGLVWRAPSILPISATTGASTVTFKGAGVSDGILNGLAMTRGFGPFASPILVGTPLAPASRPPSITKILTTATSTTGLAALVFFVDENFAGGVNNPTFPTTGYTLSYALTSSGINGNTVGTGLINTVKFPQGPAVGNITLPQTVQGNKSPIVINIAAAIAAAGAGSLIVNQNGGILTVRMTATINGAPTGPSNTVSIPVGALSGQQLVATQAVTTQLTFIARNFPTLLIPTSTLDLTLAYPFSAICDGAFQAQVQAFKMPWAADADAGCAFYQAALQTMTNFNAQVAAATPNTVAPNTVPTAKAGSAAKIVGEVLLTITLMIAAVWTQARN